jgi:hypothetical protein
MCKHPTPGRKEFRLSLAFGSGGIPLSGRDGIVFSGRPPRNPSKVYPEASSSPAMLSQTAGLFSCQPGTITQ